jgi:hypothetical protein
MAETDSTLFGEGYFWYLLTGINSREAGSVKALTNEIGSSYPT